MSRLVSCLRVPLRVAAFPLVLSAGGAGADMWQDREALRQVIAGYREAGLMTPMVADLDVYRDAALQQALAIARGAPGGACERAVQLALYMDARRAPVGPDTLRRVHEGGPLGDLAALWRHPEGGDVFAPLAWGWSEALWRTVEGLDRAVPSLGAFTSAARRLADEKRDLWVQEIVSMGLESGWDGAELVHAEARLDHAALRALEWVRSTEAWTRTRIAAADEHFRRGLQQAEHEWQAAHAGLRQEVGNWRYEDPQDAAVVFRKGEIDNGYRAARAVAHAERARQITEAMVLRAENLAMALEDLARARMQKAALRHYLEPLVAGNCASLSRRD